MATELTMEKTDGDIYLNTVSLAGSIDTEYQTDQKKNIYTRSMVRDVNATGYKTESATITSGQRFVSIDTETFDAKFNKVYHDVVLSGAFVSDISSYYNSDDGSIKIVASTGSDIYLLAEGIPTDKDFITEVAKWGITITSPFGVL